MADKSKVVEICTDAGVQWTVGICGFVGLIVGGLVLYGWHNRQAEIRTLEIAAVKEQQYQEAVVRLALTGKNREEIQQLLNQQPMLSLMERRANALVTLRKHFYGSEDFQRAVQYLDKGE